MVHIGDQRFVIYELWAAAADAFSIWGALTAAGATPVGGEALEMFRVAAGMPRYGLDIRERDLPQETAQVKALNFAKGCYIGQEIVERIRSRGNVHRTFIGFLPQSVPPSGAKVQVEGKDVGEVTSALTIPVDSSDRALALGYIRREFGKPGTAVQIGGVPATVSALPFPDIF
jgi:aminomethyltransferase